MAGLDPVRVEVHQRPVNDATFREPPERAADHPGRSGGRAFVDAPAVGAGAA